jgi:predicted nucleotidyltransferase component of viral defense system
MELPALQNFSLAGGTALALKYGHRMSVDLDLFDNDSITGALHNEFKNSLQIRSAIAQVGIFAFIEDVKIDIIFHPHPLIRPVEKTENIRMYSTEDIMAMKIQAVIGRGKKKDFWDVAELLHSYTIQNFIDYHKEKYSTQNLLITVPQAIAYFADAEESEDPISLKGQTWENVKNDIKKAVSNYLK